MNQPKYNRFCKALNSWIPNKCFQYVGWCAVCTISVLAAFFLAASLGNDEQQDPNTGAPQRLAKRSEPPSEPRSVTDANGRIDALADHDPFSDRRPVAVEGNGYVSSGQCRSCHAQQHETWHASHHRTMTQVPTPATVIADFDNHVIQREGWEFRFFRKGDEYFMGMKRLAPVKTEKSETSQTKDNQTEKTFQIVLSTGAHHQQSFWHATDEGRTLGKIPFIWLTAQQRWVPYGSIFFIPSSKLSMTKGVWNATCIKCHVVGGKPRYARDHGYDSHVSEFGISCQACHGPGEKHIAFHRGTATTSSSAPSNVVNPAELSHVKSSQTCGQCHSIFDLFDVPSKRKFNRTGYAFRPGDDLFDFRHVFRVGEDPENPVVKKKLEQTPEFYQRQFWSDGMVRVTGREYNGLLESPCYQRGKMSCLSCHDMHAQTHGGQTDQTWADDQLAANMRGNQACLQCHKKFQSKDELVQHTHHQADSSGSNCYNCHMPHTTLGLMKASRSHTISSPNIATTLATGRPNACNLCHLDQTLGWTADHLNQWYKHPAPNLTEDQKTVASSIRWLLEGDAGQRGIVGWHLGWKPAQQVSGTRWMAPFAAELLDDSYDVVRFIGYHALRSLPEFSNFQYDFVGPQETRQQARRNAIEIWNDTLNRPQRAKSRMIGHDGNLLQDTFDQFRARRTDPPVILTE